MDEWETERSYQGTGSKSCIQMCKRLFYNTIL